MTWIVAIACLYTLFLSSAILFSFVPSFTHIQIEFGWTAIQLVIALLISLAIIGILVILTKRFKNIGIRMIVTIAALLLGQGCILLSQITSFQQIVICWGLVVGVGIGSGIASGISNLWTWFPAKKRFRYGILGVGLGLGILMIPLIRNQLIFTYGWRWAYLTIGQLVLYSLSPIIIILIIAQFLKRKQTVY